MAWRSVAAKTMNNGPTVPLVARDLVYQIEAARLLDRVTFSAERGEFIGLIGPNGAGKTTLLKAISGLLSRNGGSVILEGRDLAKLSAKEVARTMAHVPQIAPFTYAFTSMEVVMMGRYPHMGRFQVEGSADLRIALEAMELTETGQFADRAITTLSGGERQRVFVARALAQQPRILLLDEPTANLDVQHQLKILDLVRDLVAEGITAIAAIHDLPLAARYCHRLVLLNHGRVLAEGPPEVVLTPSNVERAFGVRAVVYPDPLTGALTLSLLGPSSPNHQAGRGGRVHLICGGGTGARLMYELQRAGFTVTAGVLGAGDTDRTAADILGIEYVPVPAFSSIDAQAHRRHLSLVAEADCTVLCEVPFSLNNLRNLAALASARRLVCVETAPFAERDFTTGAATLMREMLQPVARCRTFTEAIAAVQKALDTGAGVPSAAAGPETAPFSPSEVRQREE